MATGIIDALVVTFALDATGFRKGERDVDTANKRLRESNKRTFDEMETRGKSAAQTFKSVRNEIVGLGLAFMGATTITGLISGMMSGAATADRLGQTMGMAAEKVWAWRMAMKGVGGQTAEADAALSSIEKDKVAYRLGNLDPTKLNTYGRMGISGNDLRETDPGSILKKLGSAQGKMDPQIYSGLLQQLGMPQSMIYFLNQGKAQVDKQIAAMEKDSAGQEKLAKETEDLQKAFAQLQTTIAGDLVPVLVKLVNLLNRVIPGGTGGAPADGKHVWGIPGVFEIKHAGGPAKAPAIVSRGGGAPATGDENQRAAAYGNAFLRAGFSPVLTAAILGNMQQESHFNPGAVGDGGHARGVMQWHEDRQAKFRKLFGVDVSKATPEQVAEFVKWEMDHYIKKSSRAAIMGAAATGDAGATARMVDKYYEISKGLTTGLRASAAQTYARRITVHQTNNYHVKATDPKGTAHEISKLHRRHAVAQTDRGVMP